MTLAGTTISSAIRYSIRKHCFANIIIAGPVCSGKKHISSAIAEFADTCNHSPIVTLFNQDDYYKEYENLLDTPFGTKDIISKDSFYTEKFLSDIRTFYEKGQVSICHNNLKMLLNDEAEEKTAHILEVKKKRRINIIVGTHAIDLLTPRHQISSEIIKENDSRLANYVSPYNIPEAIRIYLNTPTRICAERMEKELSGYFAAKELKLCSEYFHFIEEQTQKEIAYQKEMADIVINCF